MEGFPKTLEVKARSVILRMMGAQDGPLLLDFAQQLPYHDLMFLRRDITKQSSIDRWLYDIESEKMYTLLAEDETRLLGYASLYRNDFDWSGMWLRSESSYLLKPVRSAWAGSSPARRSMLLSAWVSKKWWRV